MADAAAERNRLAFAALGFGLAAAFSSWNPLAAPFGLVVGVVALLISVRSLRLPAHRRVAIAAFAASFLAIVASGVVIALTAGVGRELGGTPVVVPPARQDVTAELDAARERTRASRERAAKELDALEGPAPAPEGAGSATRGGRR
jgi:hypothetical protein